MSPYSDASPMFKLINEVMQYAKQRPKWNYHKDHFGKNQYKKTNRILKPGSYKRVLNRRNKSLGCLFWESKATSDKTEGKFSLLASKNKQPIIGYTKKCILCKTHKVLPKIRRKIWRKHSMIDNDFKALGLLITKNPQDFSVHQMCMDYAHGKSDFISKSFNLSEKICGYSLYKSQQLSFGHNFLGSSGRLHRR